MRARGAVLLVGSAVICAAADAAHLQYDDYYDDYATGSAGGYDTVAAGASGAAAATMISMSVMPRDPLVAAGTSDAAAATGAPSGDDAYALTGTLYCDGVRYPLQEERADTGPARLVRLAELTRTINVVGRALDPGICGAAPGGSVTGECIGLVKAVDRARYVGSELFLTPEQNENLEACMLDPIGTWNEQEGSCQELRRKMSELRRLDGEALARAEYVLSVRLCDQAATLDAGVRSACRNLESALAQHAPPSGGRPDFRLDAPLPREVQEAIREIRTVTGGNFDVDALGSDLARDYRCATAGAAEGAVGPLVGLCAEHDLLRLVSDACRLATVYIDERGSVHASGSLGDEDSRRLATLCVDVSDFAPEYPLLVTVGIGADRSRPARVWPGEPIFIGHNLTGPVDSADVLDVEVRGKPRGISLAETLRVNGVAPTSPDACRIARAYVPVVDHEIPVGNEDQAVIPLSFFSGRIGETGTIEQGDAVMIWIRDIEPGGAVRVEYGPEDEPQYVGYIPPPLLGSSESLSETQAEMEVHRPPGAEMRAGAVGVDQPLVPRRARYPGSRVLRLGFPSGFFEYPVRVCTYAAARATLTGGGVPPIRNCDDPRAATILSEHVYVHGEYYFGVRAGMMGTWFPTRRLVPRRTPEAVLSGQDVWQVMEESENAFDFDVCLLLAIYPFGRDPYRFDYRFWDLSDGHYWNDVAVLVGFSMIANPFEHMYAGLSLPLYSGVSFTVLAHFNRRGVPIGVREGDMFQYAGGEPDIGSVYGTDLQFVTGIAFGISVDYDLFERAFKAIYNRFTDVAPFQSSGYDYGGW